MCCVNCTDTEIALNPGSAESRALGLQRQSVSERAEREKTVGRMLNLEFKWNSTRGHVTLEPGVLISFCFALTWSLLLPDIDYK